MTAAAATVLGPLDEPPDDFSYDWDNYLADLFVASLLPFKFNCYVVLINLFSSSFTYL